MNDTPRWVGWVKLFNRWIKLTDQHETLSAAHRALDLEVKRRRISVHARYLVVTAGGLPRDLTCEPAADAATQGS